MALDRVTSENSKVEIAGAGGVSLMASAGDVELVSADNVRIQSSGGSVSTESPSVSSSLSELSLVGVTLI